MAEPSNNTPTPTPPTPTHSESAPAVSSIASSSSLHFAYLHAWPLIGKLGTGDPFPIKKLDFDAERSLLFSTLNQANKAIRLQMDVATSDNLLRLITMGCRAIHYTGHGMPTCLAFEDDEGKMHPMDPAQLKELVEAGRSSTPSSSSSSSSSSSGIEFVFVSACHSESAGLAFVAAGVPHVIAVKTEAAVCDRASQIFMKHFYLALLVGKTVRASFDIGQKAVRHNPRLAGGDEPRKFLLLPEHADHEKALFTDIAPGRWMDASPPPVPHTIPAIPDNFLGRNFLIQKVIANLTKKRLVTLTGPRGIGKCWGRGTQMRMYNGSVKNVEDIVEGDDLLGDDGTPRRVQFGSLTRGNTSKDGPDACTYRVMVHDTIDGQPWTCNDEHILVLQFPPSPIMQCNNTGSYYFHTFLLRGHEVDSHTHTYSTFDSAFSMHSSYSSKSFLLWEGPIKHFIKFAPIIREGARMFRPDPKCFDPAITHAAYPINYNSLSATTTFNSLHLCHTFAVERVEHADYYGFTLDGNGRCCLANFIVTHNVSPQ